MYMYCTCRCTCSYSSPNMYMYMYMYNVTCDRLEAIEETPSNVLLSITGGEYTIIMNKGTQVSHLKTMRIKSLKPLHELSNTVHVHVDISENNNLTLYCGHHWAV